MKDEAAFSIGDTHTLLSESPTTRSYLNNRRSFRSILWITFSVINAAVFAFNLFQFTFPHFTCVKENLDAVRLRTHG
jgi:hypothetical protein